jgi:hypothetical protein
MLCDTCLIDHPGCDEPIDSCEFCPEADRIEEGDWTTEDGLRFYQDGKLVLDSSEMTDAQAERAAGRIMRKQQWFPNVWFVSDHGNVSLFTF